MDTQQQKSKILLIGDSCQDVYCFGTCTRISQEAPVPILKVSRTESRSGMVLNVKKNLENFFDGSVDLYTNKKQIIKKRFVEETTNQHMFRVDIGEEKKLEPMSLADLDSISYEDYDCVIISDYNKGYVTREVASAISRETDQLDVPLFVDTKKDDLTCFSNAIVKINEQEYNNLKSLDSFNGRLIVTLGSQGAKIWPEEKLYPTKKVEVFDVCGAGDTFFASFIYSYLLDENLIESVKFANKCASVSVRKFGTYAVKKEEVL